MNYTLRAVLLWVFAVVFTLSVAIYQRMTGPTYPKREKIEYNGKEMKLEFLRTAETNTTEGEEYGMNGKFFDFSFPVADPEITGSITYRRYKSHDEWTSAPLERKGDELWGRFPEQPWAGKTEYRIELRKGEELIFSNAETVILRFKGAVPDGILIPHILLMFLAMLFSTRAGVAAIANERQTFLYTALTLLFLVPGGMVLGPIVQKYAFGAYWTGWPLGTDLTDNKTAIAFLGWIVAFFVMLRNRKKRWWALVAALILLAVYLIPHSVLGSEIDYREEAQNETSISE
jgi:hypothetical protein